LANLFAWEMCRPPFLKRWYLASGGSLDDWVGLIRCTFAGLRGPASSP